MTGINPVTDVMRVGTVSMVVKIVPVSVAVIVPVVIVLVIMRVPVIMVSVVVMPVVWTPWVPVGWVEAPVPRRAPCYIPRDIYEPYQGPCCHFIVSCSYYRHILPAGVR